MVLKLTPNDMVRPKGIAPFEAALAFQLWIERTSAALQDHHHHRDELPEICGGLGPSYRLQDERPTEYGERCAVALFTLIKEI